MARREDDIRAGRFESEVRSAELLDPKFAEKRKFLCIKCNRMYEERSRYCPGCDTKTMGEIKRIPDRHIEEARRNSIRRATSRYK